MNCFFVTRRTERVPFTCTALMRRPTTSFSRSRRSVSTSGSSGMLRVLRLEREPCLARGRLLGLLLGPALPLAPGQLIDVHDRGEDLGVVGALVADLVPGQLVVLARGQLLQPGLEILPARPGRRLGDAFAEQPHDQLGRGPPA